MSDPLSELTSRITATGWIAYIVVVTLAIIGLANLTEALRKIHKFFHDIFAHLKGRKFSDSDLKKKALETAQRLMDITQARQASEPEFDFKQVDHSTNSLIKHSQETSNIYYRDFAGLISHLRDEFHKRNLRDDELDSFYEHPTNYIGLRIVAMRLAALAEKVGG